MEEKKEVFKAFARALGLLGQLVIGEEKHREIYDDIKVVSQFAKHNKLDVDSAEAIEILLDLKLLFELGYLPNDELQKEILSSPLEHEVIERIKSNKGVLIKVINAGIQASNLT